MRISAANGIIFAVHQPIIRCVQTEESNLNAGNETIEELTNKVEELTAEVEDIGDIVAAGQCGENVFYAMYSNGKVLLKGSGTTYDYGSSAYR